MWCRLQVNCVHCGASYHSKCARKQFDRRVAVAACHTTDSDEKWNPAQFSCGCKLPEQSNSAASFK